MKQAIILQEASFGEDKLVLEYKEQVEYAGYEPADVFEVYFLERTPHQDEDRGCSYNVVCTETFPADDFRSALKHYLLRKNDKNPAKGHRGYWHLSTILTPKTRIK